MVLNTQTPHPIYNQQPRTTKQDTSRKQMKTQHAHNHKKRIQTNHVKTIIIFIFTSKQNKNDQAAQFTRQKEQRKP